MCAVGISGWEVCKYSSKEKCKNLPTLTLKYNIHITKHTISFFFPYLIKIILIFFFSFVFFSTIKIQKKHKKKNNVLKQEKNFLLETWNYVVSFNTFFSIYKKNIEGFIFFIENKTKTLKICFSKTLRNYNCKIYIMK